MAERLPFGASLAIISRMEASTELSVGWGGEGRVVRQADSWGQD